MKEVRVSGAAMRDQNAVLEELLGRPLIGRALLRMRSDQREELVTVLPISWIRVSTAIALINAAGAECGEDPMRLHERVVRRSLERTLTTVWRLVLRFTTDTMLFSRAPVVYAKSHDAGALSVPTVEGRRATSALTGWPDVPKMSLQGIAIGMETALRLGGRKEPVVRVERRADGAVFVATWGA
jgi:hypothetical protein